MSGARLVLWFVAIALAPTGSALWRVWVRQQTVSLGYQLHQAEQRGEALRAELQKVEVARAAGRTPQRVAAMARTLGMAPPSTPQLIACPRPRPRSPMPSTAP